MWPYATTYRTSITGTVFWKNKKKIDSRNKRLMRSQFSRSGFQRILPNVASAKCSSCARMRRLSFEASTSDCPATAFTEPKDWSNSKNCTALHRGSVWKQRYFFGEQRCQSFVHVPLLRILDLYYSGVIEVGGDYFNIFEFENFPYLFAVDLIAVITVDMISTFQKVSLKSKRHCWQPLAPVVGYKHP